MERKHGNIQLFSGSLMARCRRLFVPVSRKIELRWALTVRSEIYNLSPMAAGNAFRFSVTIASAVLFNRLSDREKEITLLVVEGMSNHTGRRESCDLLLEPHSPAKNM